MTSEKFHKLFEAPPRKKETELTQFHMDLAASIQLLTEEIVIKLCKVIKKRDRHKEPMLSWRRLLKMRSKWKVT